MTPKDHLLEGTFWDKFWRPIRSRALLFTPDHRAKTSYGGYLSGVIRANRKVERSVNRPDAL